jgi:predicted RNA binding protein YcfA (HicA-like mRNA interferase family)
LNRSEFIRELTQAGCRLLRHGARHDIYENPAKGRKAPVPRHSEIKNSLCRLIRRQLGLEEQTGS